MKRKIYTYLTIGVVLFSGFINNNVNAQNQEYWRENFDAAGPSADPATPMIPITPVDYAGNSGVWRFYGVWITTGTGCSDVGVVGNNRHVRSTSNTTYLADTAYLITPRVAYGINQLRWVRSRTNRRLTVYKTSDTSINTTNWELAYVQAKSAGIPVMLCQDTAIVINDVNAKRLMIKFEKAQNNDIDSIAITSVNAIVPIKFSSINAQQANGFVKVSWTIQTEINTLKYEVEKSLDGRNFTAIGSLTASNAGKYSWIDNSLSANDSYYRIKGIDKDGTLTYSTIVRINSGKQLAELNVTPNPVQGSLLNLQLSNAEKGIYTLRLYNNTGALVFSKSISNEGGAFSRSVELPASVTKGVYLLQLTNGAAKLAKSIIVQ